MFLVMRMPERPSIKNLQGKTGELGHFAVAIPSVSLFIARPRQVQRKGIGTSSKYADTGSSCIYDHVEATDHTSDAEHGDGNARISTRAQVIKGIRRCGLCLGVGLPYAASHASESHRQRVYPTARPASEMLLFIDCM
jgi:hypothetical protein